MNIGIKSLILRVHLAMRRSSGKTDPKKTVECILLDIWSIGTVKNEKSSLLSKSLYMKNLSSILISRLKNKGWFSCYLSLSSTSLGRIFTNDVRDSLPSFIA